MTTTMGERIRIAREAIGFSQSQLARAIGAAQPSVNQWESGRYEPGKKYLVKISLVTNMSLDWLIAGGELPPKKMAGSVMPVTTRKRQVPMVSLSTEALKGQHKLEEGPRVSAIFPCGPNCYAITLPDNANSPQYPAGTVWICDPDMGPEAGKMVVAICGEGDTARPVCGRLRYETTDKGKVTVVEPRNPDWPKARSDLEMIDIMAVMTQSISPG